MTHLRTGLLALFAALAANAGTSGSVIAAPVDPMQATDPSATADTSVRKGTRNYREAAPPAPVTTAPATNGDFSDADKLAQCMDTWDKGTHITKAKWRDICKRQLDAR